MENLLSPRFKVIADYPKSIYNIGEIIDNGYDSLFCDEKSKKFSDYPNLFKKLNWWEKRNSAEMPKYLKQKVEPDIDIFHYEKIIRWEMDNIIGVISDKDRTCCDLDLWKTTNQYLPATKEEYESYNS